MKSGKILLTVLVALLVAVGINSCTDNDSDKTPSASVALLGIWHLRSVNGTAVSGNAARRSYFFYTDAENPTNFSGKGNYYQYSDVTEQEESYPLSWEIDDSGKLVITGTKGAGVFEFVVKSTQIYMLLEMTDVADGTEYLFMK